MNTSDIEFEEIKLNECPFCGCSDDVHLFMKMQEVNGGYKEVGAYVYCYGCLSQFTQVESNSPKEVAEAWNRRAPRIVLN